MWGLATCRYLCYDILGWLNKPCILLLIWTVVDIQDILRPSRYFLGLANFIIPNSLNLHFHEKVKACTLFWICCSIHLLLKKLFCICWFFFLTIILNYLMRKNSFSIQIMIIITKYWFNYGSFIFLIIVKVRCHKLFYLLRNNSWISFQIIQFL